MYKKIDDGECAYLSVYVFRNNKQKNIKTIRNKILVRKKWNENKFYDSIICNEKEKTKFPTKYKFIDNQITKTWRRKNC